MEAPAIGIDLGTSYSCVGVYRHGHVAIIANDHGHRTTPTCVAFKDEERCVGEAAKCQQATNASNTVFDAKRLIGRLFHDEAVQLDMRHWPFEVVEQKGKPKIRVLYQGVRRTFFPEEISAMVMAKMKQVAECYLGQKVTKAVVTVPADFSDSQRQATKDAAAIAGLEVLRLINEPTAAAVAYALLRIRGRTWTENTSLVFFILGGWMCNVSVLTIEGGFFRILATAGDTRLGGRNFDNLMVDHFAQEFQRQHNRDLSTSKRALCQLRTACEIAKRALTSNAQAHIDIPRLFEGVDFHSTITREQFDDLNADLFQNILELVERALGDAGMERAAVNEVILVGGSTRIPLIQDILREFFGGRDLSQDINPEEAMAYGAAVQAAILNGGQFDHVRDLQLQDLTPLLLGVENDAGDPRH